LPPCRAAWEAEARRGRAIVVVLDQGNTATVLAKRTPFSAAELAQLETLAAAQRCASIPT
jgi:hypothetical protein